MQDSVSIENLFDELQTTIKEEKVRCNLKQTMAQQQLRSIQDILLSEKLSVIRSVDEGRNYAEIAQEFNVSTETIALVYRSRERYETLTSQPQQRHDLGLSDKLKVAHKMELFKNVTKVGRICGIGRKTVSRIYKKKQVWLEQENMRVPIGVKRPLYARYPAIDAEVVEFVNFARSQRLPVSSCLIKMCALLAERKNNIQFTASNGWLQKFIRRSTIQPSLKLHGKGGAPVAAGTELRMIEIRQILSTYQVNCIYNMDESGLFYRIGPSRTYLSANESRNDARGTELQKSKHRVTTVLCVNGDGCSAMPVHYIGKSARPMCLRESQNSSFQKQYWSQQNVWMDSNGFKYCISIWYEEIKKISYGP